MGLKGGDSKGLRQDCSWPSNGEGMGVEKLPVWLCKHRPAPPAVRGFPQMLAHGHGGSVCGPEGALKDHHPHLKFLMLQPNCDI